jgi:hypothetical protein
MRTFDHNQMADFVAIQRLQASYADIVTRRQWAELEQVFVPDATVTIDVMEGNPFVLRTPAGIGEFIGRRSTAFGLYRDTYVKRVDDWLIAERKYRSAARTAAREFDVFGFDVSD